MKLKIAIVATLIFLVGCKTKEVRVENTFKSDSSNHVEIKKNIEILTLQTDTGIVIEEEVTDYQITTDSAGIKTSMPIKKIKKKFHKYKIEIRAAAREETKVEQMAIVKKEIKRESVERTSFQIKWSILIILFCLLLLLLLFLYIK
jgi:HSP20 family molecular chaperone IbpA